MALDVVCGPFKDAYLALLRFYIDAGDWQLEELKVTREEVLKIARYFENLESGYAKTELTTTAHQLIIAYKAGVNSPIPEDDLRG